MKCICSFQMRNLRSARGQDATHVVLPLRRTGRRHCMQPEQNKVFLCFSNSFACFALNCVGVLSTEPRCVGKTS